MRYSPGDIGMYVYVVRQPEDDFFFTSVLAGPKMLTSHTESKQF